MKTLLVIGATGTIGKEVVALLSRSAEARVLAGSRDVGRSSERFPEGVRGLDQVATLHADLYEFFQLRHF